MGIDKKTVKKIKLGAVLIAFICGAALSFNGVSASENVEVPMSNSKTEVSVKNKKTNKRKKSPKSRDLDLYQEKYEELGLDKDNEDKSDAVLLFTGMNSIDRVFQWGMLLASPTYLVEQGELGRKGAFVKGKTNFFYEIIDKESGATYRSWNDLMNSTPFGEGDYIGSHVQNWFKKDLDINDDSDIDDNGGIYTELGENGEPLRFEDGKKYIFKVYNKNDFEDAIFEGEVLAKEFSEEELKKTWGADNKLTLDLRFLFTEEYKKELLPLFRHPEKFDRKYYKVNYAPLKEEYKKLSKRLRKVREEAKAGQGAYEVEKKAATRSSKLEAKVKVDSNDSKKEKEEIKPFDAKARAKVTGNFPEQVKKRGYDKQQIALYQEEYEKQGFGRNSEGKPDAVLFFGNNPTGKGKVNQMGTIAMSPTNILGQGRLAKEGAFVDGFFYEIKNEKGAIYRNKSDKNCSLPFPRSDTMYSSVKNLADLNKEEETGAVVEPANDGTYLKFEDGKTYTLTIYDNANFDNIVFVGNILAKESSQEVMDFFADRAENHSFLVGLLEARKIAPQFKHPKKFDVEYYTINHDAILKKYVQLRLDYMDANVGKHEEDDINDTQVGYASAETGNAKDATVYYEEDEEKDVNVYNKLNLGKSFDKNGKEKPEAVAFLMDKGNAVFTTSPTYIIEQSGMKKDGAFVDGFFYEIEDEEGAIVRSYNKANSSVPFNKGDYLFSKIKAGKMASLGNGNFVDENNGLLYKLSDQRHVFMFEDGETYKFRVYDSDKFDNVVFEGNVVAKSMSDDDENEYRLTHDNNGEFSYNLMTKVVPQFKHPKKFDREYYRLNKNSNLSNHIQNCLKNTNRVEEGVIYDIKDKENVKRALYERLKMRMNTWSQMDDRTKEFLKDVFEKANYDAEEVERISYNSSFISDFNEKVRTQISFVINDTKYIQKYKKVFGFTKKDLKEIYESFERPSDRSFDLSEDMLMFISDKD